MRLKKFVLSDNSTIYVEVVSYGARLHHLGRNSSHNVIVSPTNMYDYLNDISWKGATVGPMAHILRDGVFEKDSGNLYFEKNHLGHHLHGGRNGFHRQNWQVEKHTNHTLHLGLNTQNGDRFTILYKISPNTLSITYTAKVKNTTLVNMTNHAYFNISSEDKIYNHRVKINAQSVVSTDANNIALPTISSVYDSVLDLNNFRELSVISKINKNNPLKKTNGYNHCYLLAKKNGSCAEIENPLQKYNLRISTTKPAIHFFTTNNIQPLFNKKLVQHSALCLEPVYPTSDYLKGDAAISLLHPNKVYCETDTYKFINRFS